MRAAWLMLCLAATPAAAQTACAGIDDPLAYNACLAKQGPAARAVRVGSAPAAALHQSQPPRRVFGAARRSGRAELVFSPRR